MNVKIASKMMSTGMNQACHRWRSSLLWGVATLLVASQGAMATTPPAPGILSAGTHDIYYRADVLSDEGMSELRGGFRMAGLDLNFGATLTTEINDRVRYITQVAFDNAGARVLSRTLEQSLAEGMEAVSLPAPPQGHGDIVTIAPPAETASTPFSPSSPAVPSAAGNANEATGTLDLAGLSDFSGVVLDDPEGGMTAALHNITRNAIVSSLSTTASGQRISNDIDVSVQVLNIGEMRQTRQRSLIFNSLRGILPR